MRIPEREKKYINFKPERGKMNSFDLGLLDYDIHMYILIYDIMTYFAIAKINVPIKPCHEQILYVISI